MKIQHSGMLHTVGKSQKMNQEEAMNRTTHRQTIMSLEETDSQDIQTPELLAKALTNRSIQ